VPDHQSNRPADPFDGLRDLQRRERRRRHAVGGGGDEGESRAPEGSSPAFDRLARLQLPRRRRWPRRLLIGLNLSLGVVLIAGLSAFGYVEYRLGQVQRVAVPGLAKVRDSGPFTVLVIGSDSRALGKSGGAQFGTAAETPGQRSDTVMLVRVVPSARRMEILSIPRDLWVDIPGVGASKINSAFDSGPALLIETIQKEVGIPINHFVELNFDSFRDITDAVGGVKVWFPTPARDPYSLLSIPNAGCVLLTGNQALGFARSRHYTYYQDGQWIQQGLSDLARIQRQQMFVKKMIEKAESEFTDPAALNGVIGGVTKNLIVDKGFSSTEMIELALDFHSADVAGIPTETLPVDNYWVDGQEALSLQQPGAAQMIHAFNTFGDPAAPAPAATPAPATTPAPTASPPSTTAATATTPIRTVPAADRLVTSYPLPGPAPTEGELADC
jgi:LCP family protein required for cell wall assembly